MQTFESIKRHGNPALVVAGAAAVQDLLRLIDMPGEGRMGPAGGVAHRDGVGVRDKCKYDGEVVVVTSDGLGT